MIGRLRAVLIVAGFVLIVTLLASGRRDAVAAATVTRYEEVKDWPSLPPSVQLGETAGVAVDANGHVFIFHRPGRGFDLTATTKLTEPTVLEIDANTGKLISSWGANMFLVPHGITIDRQNNVFLTDVSLQQVFKFTHDGKLIFALGEPRVGAWDATHFNEPTDIAIRPDGTFYVSDGYVNSRVALFDRNGKWLQEWGKKGSGEGEFSNPHGLVFVPGSTDVLVADRENSRLQLFDRAGKFKRQWTGAKDAQTTGRVFVSTPIPMVSFTSEFAAPTTIPNIPASSSSTATGILSRPSASGNPAIRCSTPFTISRSAAMARFTWPKHEPSGSSSSAR